MCGLGKPIVTPPVIPIPDDELVHLSVCSDCLYYSEYGQLDDQTMLDMEQQTEAEERDACESRWLALSLTDRIALCRKWGASIFSARYDHVLPKKHRAADLGIG